MNLEVTIKLVANTSDGSTSVDTGNLVNVEHKLEFILSGDNLNGPSIITLENKFFELAKKIREVIA